MKKELQDEITDEHGATADNSTVPSAATDRLKEYIVRIDSFKVFNLKTNIIIEDGKNTDSFLSKDEIIN